MHSSPLLIYLPLSHYLRQWLVHALGHPVHFPKGSYEHALLARHLQRVPPGACVQLWGEGMVAVAVPRLRGKPAESYNYLSRRGRVLLVDAVTQLFLLDMWSGLAPAIGRPSLGEAIENWCRSRGITPEHREAVRRRFYRIRQHYAEQGILLGRTYRKRKSVT